MASDSRPGVDLHIHSTASDGSASPLDVLRMAVDAGLSAFSLTDHDTLEGAAFLLESGIPAHTETVEFITGVEISTQSPEKYRCKGSLHILGYGVEVHDPALNRALKSCRDSRKERNPRILARLNDLGMDLTMDDVTACSPDGQIGRPHIAKAMIAKGYVATIDEAFDRFLGNDQPAYVKKYRIPCAEAIEAVRNAGGVAVLAHPVLIEPMAPFDFEEFVRELVGYGLEGIETRYPEHTWAQRRKLETIARRYDLVTTGGTDFHGSVRPGIAVGVGDGSFSVPYTVYAALKERIARKT